MITTLGITTTIYQDLVAGGFGALLTGDIYKDVRPTGSQAEDCVVNCLPVTGDQVQVASANVNIYAPDINMMLNGKNEFMPDHSRLNTLAQAAIAILEYVSDENYDYYIVNQSLEKEEVNQHYINLRIEFRNYNL